MIDLYSPTGNPGSHGFYRWLLLSLVLNFVILAVVAFAVAFGALLAYVVLL